MGQSSVVTSISTLPTTPASTASCACAVASSGNRCSGSPAVLPDRQRPVGDRGRDVGHGAVLQLGRQGVDEDELVPDVGHHVRADRQRDVAAGVDRDGRVRRHHRGVQLGVDPGIDLDDEVDPVRRDARGSPRPAAGSR